MLARLLFTSLGKQEKYIRRYLWACTEYLHLIRHDRKIHYTTTGRAEIRSITKSIVQLESMTEPYLFWLPKKKKSYTYLHNKKHRKKERKVGIALELRNVPFLIMSKFFF